MSIRQRIETRNVDGQEQFALRTDTSARLFAAKESWRHSFKISTNPEHMEDDGDGFSSDRDYWYFNRESLVDLRDFAQFLINRLDGVEDADRDPSVWRPLAA